MACTIGLVVFFLKEIIVSSKLRDRHICPSFNKTVLYLVNTQDIQVNIFYNNDENWLV